MKAITFTTEQAAEYLGISYWLILELIKRKEIPCTNFGKGRRKLFRQQSLDRWMTEQEDLSQEDIEHVKEYTGIRRIN